MRCDMLEFEEFLKKTFDSIVAEADRLGLENVRIDMSHGRGYMVDEIEVLDSNRDVLPRNYVPHWQLNLTRHNRGEWQDLTEKYNS